MVDYAVWGAGKNQAICHSALQFLGINIKYYIDNDASKTGSQWEGVPICSSEVLLHGNFHVIVGCSFLEEIAEQLRDMGFQGPVDDFLVFMEAYINENHGRIRAHVLSGLDIRLSEETTYVIEAYSTSKKPVWGGLEVWCGMLTDALSAQGKHAVMLSSPVPYLLNNSHLPAIQPIACDTNTIENIIRFLLVSAPVCFIHSLLGFTGRVVLVASKLLFPEYISTISVLHSDIPSRYRLALSVNSATDQFLCVSSRIHHTFTTEYGMDPNRTHYHINPVYPANPFKKTYSPQGAPLRIGWAARMSRIPKNAHLFPAIIEELLQKAGDFILEIAGDGACFALVENYIAANNLSHKVKLLGYIAPEHLDAFWIRQDIFLSFSSVEGCSLSMLEAMLYGCVPVTTDVSGVSDLIEHKANGMVCDIGSIPQIAEAIAYLHQNRELLPLFGERCRNHILTQCNIEDYARFVIALAESF